MPGQVPEQVKTLRSRELLELTERQSKEFRSRYIGREAEVLMEEIRELRGRTYLLGHTKDYVKVAVDVTENILSDVSAINTVMSVPVTKFLTDEILI